MSTPKTAPEPFYYPRADLKSLANLPHGMTAFKSFVTWKEAPPDTPGGKYKKKPLNALTLSGDDWNNPRNWHVRALATQTFEENAELRGIGFVFHKCRICKMCGKCHKADEKCPDDVLKHTEDPYTFFDLDGVLDESGKLESWADEFVKLCESYTEISPSRTGIKIIAEGKLGNRDKTLLFKDKNGKEHEVEVYDTNRFFAATGNRLEGTPANIREWQEGIDMLCGAESREDDAAASGAPLNRSDDKYASAVDAMSDDKLLARISESIKGKEFDRLWNGNLKGFAGRFSASGALCMIAAYWTRANPQRIDRLYRSSKLFEVAGGSDWWDDDDYRDGLTRGQYMIASACRKAASKPMYPGPASASGLITNKDGEVRTILANAITYLTTDPAFADVLAFNELTLTAVKLKPTPWGTTGNWTDYDDSQLCVWYQRDKFFFINSRLAAEAAQTVAQMKKFHPVRDYLNGLQWDGTPRLDTWLHVYLGVADTLYTRAVGRCWMISAVARPLQPGCKVDYLLLLQGGQGIKKSQALAALAGKGFFSDHMPDFSKDSVLEVHSIWIMELAELAGVRGATSEKVKSFFSPTDDLIRLPYGRRVDHHPRAFVLCGSTNSDTPFTDETGNRRYWPVKCTTIDIEKLKADRDQLWAEAVALYKKGEHWWLDAAIEKLAEKEQSKRYQPGQWDTEIIEWLKNPTQQSEELWSEDKKGMKSCTMKPVEPFHSSKEFVTVSDILMHAIGKPKDRWTKADIDAVTKCLKSHHWESGARKRFTKKVIRGWRREKHTDDA